MYTELLAKASQTQHANVAHPSFVNIISSISPGEAIVIKSVRHLTGIPFIEVRSKFKDKDEWNTLNPMVIGIPCFSELSCPGNVQAYFSNLEGLGIFQIRTDIYIVGENIYEPLEEYAKKLYLAAVVSTEDRVLDTPKGKIEITPFGRLLMHACFSNKKA
jgi:hypothetical protein